MKIISSKQVYDCGLFRVTEDVAVDPKTKFQIKRSVVRHIGSAVMMAVDDKRRVLLVRQYRLPAAKYLWELPAGRLDPGEKPLPGGILYARYGKGVYIYTSYSWFRQLPAGVPGAWRIFANLVSAGHAPR